MKMETDITVSLAVYKEIVQRQEYVDESADSVLRRILLSGERSTKLAQKRQEAPSRPLNCRGGKIPHGTRLRRKIYKGREWRAEVRDGRIYVEGTSQAYYTPSAAAASITKNPVNGWSFWQYQKENGAWGPLDELREK